MRERQPRRRYSTGVELVDLLFFGDIDEREEITAHADICRIGNTERRRCGDGRINGIAPLLEDPQTGLRRERLNGAHDAVPRHHLRAALLEPSFRSIASDGLAGRRHRSFRANLRGRRLSKCEARIEYERNKEKRKECVPSPAHMFMPLCVRMKDSADDFNDPTTLAPNVPHHICG